MSNCDADALLFPRLHWQVIETVIAVSAAAARSHLVSYDNSSPAFSRALPTMRVLMMTLGRETSSTRTRHRRRQHLRDLVTPELQEERASSPPFGETPLCKTRQTFNS